MKTKSKTIVIAPGTSAFTVATACEKGELFEDNPDGTITRASGIQPMDDLVLNLN